MAVSARQRRGRASHVAVAAAVWVIVASTAGTGTSLPNTAISPTASSRAVATAPVSSCPAPARRLTLRAEAGQVVMASVAFNQTGVAVRWVHDVGVGGIAFFGTPNRSVGTDVAHVRSATAGGLRPFTAVDEEGGRVQRLAAVLGRIPSARQMAATMTTTAVRDLARRHAAGMRQLGFTVDLAPDMDVTGSTSGVIGDRSFSADAATASRYAQAFAAGLADSHVMATGKHFPGHGHASGDSHVQAVTTPPLAQLEQNDLIPFRNAASALVPSIMVGHLTVPGLTHGLPASLSPDAVTGLLRQRFGYDGLIISDSLGMVSVTIFEPDLGSAAVRTLRAGVDVALLPEGADPAPVIDHIMASVSSGALARADLDRAVRHVVMAKALDGDRASAWLLTAAASQDFLGRAPSAVETSCWIAQLASGLVSRATMMRDLSLSPVWVGRNVDALYHRALRRSPSSSARAYWVDAIGSRRRSFTTYTATAFGSAEYFNLSGGTVDAWISALYRQFLDRTPDGAGLAYWRTATSVHGRPWVAESIYQSGPSRAIRAAAKMTRWLHRTPDGSGVSYWSQYLATHDDIELDASLAATAEYLHRAQG